MPLEAAPGEPVALFWGTTGGQVTICPTARVDFFTEDDCWEAPNAGMASYTIPAEAEDLRFINFSLTLETDNDTPPQVSLVSVALTCDRKWFFSDEPVAGICPLESVTSNAAVQDFQSGRMIWVEELGRYFIFENRLLDGEEVRKRITFMQDPIEIVRDSSAEVNPPAGFFAPESGFGLVWRADVRDSPGYLQTLGWALAPEYGYEADYQCDDALPSGGRSWQTCYLSQPEGTVVVLHPLGGWQRLGE